MAKIARRHLTPWAWIGGALLLAAVAARATDPIVPGATGPEITGLSVSASSTALLVGGTAQLSVIATFSDGSTRDVTSDPKTSLGASPAEALSIDPTGVVTGLVSANVSITVFHQTYVQAKSATLALTVRTADDRDGDGLSDSVEIANQLNPDFAGDAGADLDQDGLTNAQEIALGTDLRKADTDGDFSPDGLEVAAGTNPLVSDLPPPPPPPTPELGSGCVISVLNRSARVEPNGAWVLPNVPSNSGPVRARATCVENGVSRSGQSDFFLIPTNGVIRVADVRFDAPQQIPTRLDLTAPSTDLTAAGQTVQLTARATYPGGAQADLTGAAAGTGYRSSNSAIAAVSAEGRVTARASGTVIVNALNEGALGVLRIRVLLSGDSDGDGLPDDFEIANGLDPNNPLDVLDDLDGDGLTNGEEFARGTDLRNPDTDGDGLRDGDEVNRYGTDPLLVDTDGDQIGDGLEIQSGSDPLDPASFNLGPILQSLTVQPASFTLVFNTAIGEASRRLSVNARLIDGTQIDVRLRRYGTVYSSSDLSVASFGAEDGVVFAGQNGSATVTVTLGAFSAQTTVQVQSFTPAPLSFLSLSGFPNGVAVSGDTAYVASGGAGLHVIDVGDLARPVLLATVPLPGNANDVRVAGGYAYVAAGAAGLQIVDVNDPAHPARVGGVDTPGDATDLAVRGNRVYVADGPAGLSVIDAAVPSAPLRVGGLDTPGNARGIDVTDDLAVVADGFGGVHVIGVADPSAPVLLGSTQTRGTTSQAASVAVRGRLAYVAEGDGNLGGLKVINFSNPGTPVVVGASSDAFGLSHVALDGGYALFSDYYFPNAVPVFDVGGAPRFTAVLNFYQAPSFRDDNGNGIAVRGDGAVFMVGTVWEIRDNGTWGNGGLHIGRWRLGGDDLGVAPEVSLTAPAAGTTARERSLLTVRATASDDVRVESVQFLVDGQPFSRVFKAPYEATLRVPEGVTSLRLGASAADLGGNQGTAEEVVVNVVPDDRPTVSLLSPSADLRIVEGTTIRVAAEATDDVQVASVDLRVNGVSRRLALAPPYQVDVQVPAAPQITVEAVATDSVGQTATTGVLTLPVIDVPPPVVAITAPATGVQVTQGSTIRVSASAASDLAVTGVRLTVNGQPTPNDTLAPFDFNVEAPSSGTELHLTAVATDSLGQTATSEEVVITLVPDPGTTVRGSVAFEDGQPVAGAEVFCRGVSGSSGADGSFTLTGVPTLAAITCSATATDAQGTSLVGTSASVAPVLGGITEVGPIVVAESLFITDLGTNTNLGDDQAVLVDLPFPFPFMGQTYTQVYLNTNGSLTFGQGSTDWTEAGGEFVSGARDIGLTDVGPTIAVFWDDLFPITSSSDTGEPGDFYRFTGAAGETIAAEVSARREGSSLDSLLTLYDAEGSVLAVNDDFSGRDSRIDFTLPADGPYFLRVVDLDGLGGANYFYHLTLSGGDAPPRDAGAEAEPNDTTESANALAYGDTISGVIGLTSSDSARNLYFNSQLPGRFVVTWNQVPEYSLGGSNTAQLALFEDGRMQMGYNGVTSDDALVGLSPANGGPTLEVDLSADTPLSTGPGTAVFEEFDGPVGPDGTDEDPPGTRPFDLDGRVLVFAPNAAGGYDVRITGALSPPPPPPPPPSVAARPAHRTTVEETLPSGTIEGTVVRDGHGPLGGLGVVLTSSADASWEARVTTDAEGRFEVAGVPAGGVNAALFLGGDLVAHAAGVLAEGDRLVLELRPASVKPKR